MKAPKEQANTITAKPFRNPFFFMSFSVPEIFPTKSDATGEVIPA